MSIHGFYPYPDRYLYFCTECRNVTASPEQPAICYVCRLLAIWPAAKDPARKIHSEPDVVPPALQGFPFLVAIEERMDELKRLKQAAHRAASFPPPVTEVAKELREHNWIGDAVSAGLHNANRDKIISGWSIMLERALVDAVKARAPKPLWEKK